MYLRTSAKAVITKANGQNITVPSLSEAHGKSGWKMLTSTATIKLARNTQYKDKNVLDYIEEGDAIVLLAGYNEQFTSRFKGYIRTIRPDAPIILECEDEMYQLKEKTYEKSWEQITLKALLSHIAPNYKHDVPNVDLGKFSIDGSTAVEVFDVLRKFKLYTYFLYDKNATPLLHCGFPYSFTGEKHVLALTGEYQNTRSNSLKYQRAKDVKIQIKAIANLKDGKKRIAVKGDKHGAIRTLNYGSKVTQKQLEEYAQVELDRVKYDGFKGTVSAFGEPFIQHNDVLEIRDEKYQRKGLNLMDELSWSISASGYKQTCKVATNA